MDRRYFIQMLGGALGALVIRPALPVPRVDIAPMPLHQINAIAFCIAGVYSGHTDYYRSRALECLRRLRSRQ